MIELSLGLLVILAVALVVILWRIMRCLEWLAMFVKGFSEKFVETSRGLDAKQGN